MKNRITDLNNHLFIALERLNQEDLTEEQIQAESQRAKAVSALVNNGIEIAKVALEGTKLQAEYLGNQSALPEMFQ